VTLFGFFFFGLKDVDMVKIQNLGHLKEVIRKAAEQASRDMLHRVWKEVE
jgi:hypothetical protein